MRAIYSRLYQAVILAALILAVSSATVIATENLTIHFIDVGQGDSELMQFAGKNILIDAGTQEMGPRVESYLKDHGVSSLDLLVATHPHDDHIGGLLIILQDFPVKQVLDSGQVHTTPTFESYLKLIDQKNIPFDTAHRGQKINLDPNLKIEVLSPPQTPLGDDLNQNSIVLKVSLNKVSFLLMADAGIEAENSLLSTDYNLKSDILKVGHHGSSSASSTAFLNAVRPTISIIEVGASNGYGHPTQKTLSALQNTGSEIYRTDTNGNVVVTTDGLHYSVTTQRQAQGTSSTGTIPSLSSSVSTQTTSSLTSSSQGQFVGSIKSNKYHYPSCQWAQKISPSNEIWFSSLRDARAHGYVPCKVCNPP